MTGNTHFFDIAKRLKATSYVGRARLKSIVACAFAVTLLGTQNARRSPKTRRRTAARENASFEAITRPLDDVTFTKAFRMSRAVFAKLLERIRPSLPLERNRFTGTDRIVIHGEVRLAITLRLLAGASYLDIRMTWNISQTSLYDIFHSCCMAIMTSLSLPGLPGNEDDLMAMSQIFKLSRSPHNPFLVV